MLEPAELKRRLAALRDLRLMKQTDLAQLLEQDDGWGKHDLGRLERGDPSIPASSGRLRAIAHHLGVSSRWLTEDDLDALLMLGEQPPPPDVTESLMKAREASRLAREAARKAALRRRKEREARAAQDDPPTEEEGAP